MVQCMCRYVHVHVHGARPRILVRFTAFLAMSNQVHSELHRRGSYFSRL